MLGTIALTGCGGGAAEPESGGADSVEDSVREGQVLQVCSTGDYRPYTYLDPETEEWSGIDIEMARSLADELDVRLDLIQVTWSEIATTVQDGGCALALGGVSLTEERDEIVDFTDATVQDLSLIHI